MVITTWAQIVQIIVPKGSNGRVFPRLQRQERPAVLIGVDGGTEIVNGMASIIHTRDPGAEQMFIGHARGRIKIVGAFAGVNAETDVKSHIKKRTTQLPERYCPRAPPH